MRVYTRAMRVPSLVGKLPGGPHLPGGPYTMTQFVGAAVVLVVGLYNVDRFLPWGWIGNRVAVLAAATATVVLLGLVKPGGRDPLSSVLAVAGVYGGPRAGRYRGRPVRIQRPHRALHRVAADIPLEAAGRVEEHLSSPVPPAAAPAAEQLALSGVGQLLARASVGTEGS